MKEVLAKLITLPIWLEAFAGFTIIGWNDVKFLSSALFDLICYSKYNLY